MIAVLWTFVSTNESSPEGLARFSGGVTVRGVYDLAGKEAR